MKDGLYQIIFLCTGNICRSPMAEGILRAGLSSTAVEFATVGSAGIAAYDGSPASTHSVTVCREHGIDISGHRSRMVNPKMVAESDLILVMEEHHRAAVLRMAREAADKTFLISDYALGEGAKEARGVGVEDPIGRELDVYRSVFRQLNGFVTRLLPRLEATIAEAKKSA